MRLSIVVLIAAVWALRLGAAEDAGAPAPVVVAPPAPAVVPPSAEPVTTPPATAASVPVPKPIAKLPESPVTGTPPAASPFAVVHLSNDLADAELSTMLGSVTTFSLRQTHPIQLPKWQEKRLRELGIAVPDHDAPLAVLDDFHPPGVNGRGAGNHNCVIGLGLPDDPPPWKVVHADTSAATFEYLDADRHLTLRMDYQLPAGKTELETRLTVANTGIGDVTIQPIVFPLNGLHQDEARSDAPYLTVAYHAGGSTGSQTSLGMPDPLTGSATHAVAVPSANLDYVCLKSRFFAAMWAPGPVAFTGGAPTSAPKTAPQVGPEATASAAATTGSGTELDVRTVGFQMAENHGDAHQAYIRASYTAAGRKDLILHPGETLTIPWRIVITSMSRESLARLSETERKVEYTDWYYRFFSLLAKILTYSLAAVVAVVRNYGVALLILTLLLKLALHRTTFKQQESMMKMQKLQPEMKRLQEEYRNDRTKLGAKTMELYKKHGVSPLSGCLPIFIQIPVFTALYLAFSHSADMRGQSFLWINDLTLPDNLIWLGFAYPAWMPFVGGSLATVNPLPLIYICVTVWMSMSQKMPSGGDPQQEQMMKTMRWLPVVFGVIFYGMPSGLVLYFTANAVLSTIEIKMVKRKLGIDSKPAVSK